VKELSFYDIVINTLDMIVFKQNASLINCEGFQLMLCLCFSWSCCVFFDEMKPTTFKTTLNTVSKAFFADFSGYQW